MTAPPSGRSTAAILFGTYVCLEIVMVAASVSGPAWRRGFGLSYMELGLCLGAAPAGMLAAGLFAGHLTERKGPLPVQSFSLGGIICALAVLAAAAGACASFPAAPEQAAEKAGLSASGGRGGNGGGCRLSPSATA